LKKEKIVKWDKKMQEFKKYYSRHSNPSHSSN